MEHFIEMMKTRNLGAAGISLTKFKWRGLQGQKDAMKLISVKSCHVEGGNSTITYIWRKQKGDKVIRGSGRLKTRWWVDAKYLGNNAE